MVVVAVWKLNMFSLGNQLFTASSGDREEKSEALPQGEKIKSATKTEEWQNGAHGHVPLSMADMRSTLYILSS